MKVVLACIKFWLWSYCKTAEIAWKTLLILPLVSNHAAKAEGCTNEGICQNSSGKHQWPFVHAQIAIIDDNCDFTYHRPPSATLILGVPVFLCCYPALLSSSIENDHVTIIASCIATELISLQNVIFFQITMSVSSSAFLNSLSVAQELNVGWEVPNVMADMHC